MKSLLGLFILASSIATVSPIQPAQAQQWGMVHPDGSIRNRYGLIMDGPNPGRLLQMQQTMPMQRRSIDLGSGSIYRGGIIQSGPSPSRRMLVCMQTGLC